MPCGIRFAVFFWRESLTCWGDEREEKTSVVKFLVSRKQRCPNGHYAICHAPVFSVLSPQSSGERKLCFGDIERCALSFESLVWYLVELSVVDECAAGFSAPAS